MESEATQEKHKKIIAEYKKGTKSRLIEAYFGITRAGLYWILKKHNVKPNRDRLTRNK
jgi:hypothetical protein